MSLDSTVGDPSYQFTDDQEWTDGASIDQVELVLLFVDSLKFIY